MLATRRSHAGRVPIAHQPRFRNAAVKRRARRTAWPSVIAHLQGCAPHSFPLRPVQTSRCAMGPLPLCRPSTSHLKQPTQEGSHARRPCGHVAPAPFVTRPRAARPACRLPSPPERAALTVVATPTAIARLRACALRRARPVPPIARMCAHAPRRMLHVKHLFLLYDGADEPNAKGGAWTMRRDAQRKRFAHG